MKKKMITLAAAGALVLSANLTVFAQGDNGTGSYTADVKGTYKAGDASDIVYHVDIIWTDMNFTYTDAGEGTWNPGTHTFDGATAAGWSSTDVQSVTVKNHSNAGITASASYTPDPGYEETDMSFDHNNNTLPSAVDTSVENAPAVTMKITPQGELPENTDGKIGTITVAIEAAGGTE